MSKADAVFEYMRTDWVVSSDACISRLRVKDVSTRISLFFSDAGHQRHSTPCEVGSPSPYRTALTLVEEKEAPGNIHTPSEYTNAADETAGTERLWLSVKKSRQQRVVAALMCRREDRRTRRRLSSTHLLHGRPR